MKNNKQLQYSSDLMQNFKAIRPVNTEKEMCAVFFNESKAFFSISDTGQLFATVEQKESKVGWKRIDISEGIREKCESTAKVMHFAAGTDRYNSKLVLAATVDSLTKQKLYISDNNSMMNPQWQEVELPEEMQKFSFYNVTVSSYKDKMFISTYFKQENGKIERYTVISSGNKWIYVNSPLPADFTEIIGTTLGRPDGSRVDGTYTLGKSQNNSQLLFTPAYNYYDPEISPLSARLVLKRKADAVSAVSVSESGSSTDVFVCGDGALYWFSSEKQEDMSEPVLIAESKHFLGVKQLFSFISNDKVYVYILNESKEVCYLFANVKDIGKADAWSVISILKDNMEYVYPFCEGKVKAIYGYTKNGEGILGYESEETGLWSYVTVFIDQNTSNPVLINSYVTLVKTPKPEQEVTITTEGKCMVEINGGIYSFTGNPVRVKSNTNGDIKITELSETIAATRFSVNLDDNANNEFWDPSEKVVKKLLELDTSDKLTNAYISSQTGEKQCLVPPDTPSQSVDAVAVALKTLGDIQNNLNGCDNANNNSSEIHLRFQSGELVHMNLQYTENSFLISENEIRAAQQIYSSEDTFGYLRSLCSDERRDGFFDVIIKFFDDAWNFIVQAGKKIVSFVIDCAEKVASCAVEIFNIIKVTVEKVIQYLKYVFDMDDILLVKDVIEKIMQLSKDETKNQIQKAKDVVESAFDEISKNIKEWGDIKDIGDIGNKSFNQIGEDSPYGQQSGDVHANYLTDTIIENSKTTSLALAIPEDRMEQFSGEMDKLLEQLSQLYEKEGDIAKEMIEMIQNEFFNSEKICDMDIITILRKLAAILASSAVQSVKEIVKLIFDLIIYIIDIFYEILNKEIYIPCVSELLKLCGIKGFSTMDLICFVPAFMGSIIYKIVNNEALISDEIHDRIMNISSLKELSILTNNSMENASFCKPLYISMKVVSTVATTAECVFAAIDHSIKHTSSVISGLVAGMALIDGACCMVNTFVYQPLKGKMSEVLQWVLLFVKYSAFVGKGISLYYLIFKKDKAKSDNYNKIFAVMYAVTSFIAISGNIYYIVEASKLEDVNNDEKQCYLMYTISLIPDNLRNTADGILQYVTPEKLQIFVVVLAIRSVLGLGYGGLQIASAVYADKI